MTRMPNYSLPGVATTQWRARLTGLFAALVAVLVAVVWTLYSNVDRGDRFELRLLTDQVGVGIVPGTNVRVEGLAIGKVAAIASVGQGRQLLTLDLDSSQIDGLTDDFTVDYAPENLFGISALTMRPGTGGDPLRAGELIDLVGKVTDVTMGALLRELTQTSTQVLTPKLAELLRQLNGDLRAFIPFLEMVVTLGGVVADTQRYPASYLLDQYSAFARGLGAFSDATVDLLYSVLEIEVLVNDGERYDAAIGMVVDQLFPGVSGALNTAQVHFHGYADMFTPLLSAMATTVPTPERSQAELAELIDRLARMFTDTPDGPMLNVAVTLRGVPAVAVPLFGQQFLDGLGGAR